jgi:hypothetical protein
VIHTSLGEKYLRQMAVTGVVQPKLLRTAAVMSPRPDAGRAAGEVSGDKRNDAEALTSVGYFPDVPARASGFVRPAWSSSLLSVASSGGDGRGRLQRQVEDCPSAIEAVPVPVQLMLVAGHETVAVDDLAPKDRCPEFGARAKNGVFLD